MFPQISTCSLSVQSLAVRDDKKIGRTSDFVKFPELTYSNVSLGEYK